MRWENRETSHPKGPYIINVPHILSDGLKYSLFLFLITRVKENNRLERCILVVVYLNILEGLDQLVQHSVGYLVHLLLGTVPVDHAAVA